MCLCVCSFVCVSVFLCVCVHMCLCACVCESVSGQGTGCCVRGGRTGKGVFLTQKVCVVSCLAEKVQIGSYLQSDPGNAR